MDLKYAGFYAENEHYGKLLGPLKPCDHENY